MTMLFEEPSYLVQIGHNGHKLAQDILDNGYADGAILSPADYKSDRNATLASRINDRDGIVLFDPQFYIPRSDRPKFDSYDYFEDFGGDEFDTVEIGDELGNLSNQILDYQDKLETDAYISPARLLDTFSDSKLDYWADITEAFIEAAEERDRDIPIYVSLPIDQRPLTDKSQRDDLLNQVTQFDPDGFYVSGEFEFESRYPLTGASNVYSMLDLLNTLKQNRYEVLVGHSHQIAHLFFGIGVDAFASGHYINLRAFDTRRWEPTDGQSGGRQVVKYYSDKLLNELRVDPDLDLMYQKDDFDLEKIRTPSDYDDPLFDGSDPPSTVGWKFRDAGWDHYIWSCYQISRKYRGKDLEEKLNTAKETVEEAGELFEEIQEHLGMLTEPEESIYSDWEASLSAIESDVL